MEHQFITVLEYGKDAIRRVNKENMAREGASKKKKKQTKKDMERYGGM